ncbi:unnamed protein product [Bemisia tabaci]|uniref:Brain tumor protein n=1 Tax=Bemisia tabaci TaxID=7038 RepID=A0A9P0F9Y6_BEMTA|nr:unnamed protein product [Bemisia tabaci]
MDSGGEENETEFRKSVSTESLNSSGPLEDASTPSDENKCSICNNEYVAPRLLACLHTFCEACIGKLLMNSGGDAANLSEDRSLACPECNHITTVSINGASSLPCDYVLTNMLDIAAIQNSDIGCSSCITKEKAVARCSDCAHFLCPNCENAHEFMRCFENHRVIKLEELKKSADLATIHKPIICSVHTSQVVSSFCHTCQKLICTECVITLHKAPEHKYDGIAESAKKSKNDIASLVTEGKTKMELCEETSTKLETALGDLETMHDTAKGLLLETYQSYKAVLEQLKDEALAELESVHKKQELVIMETCHNVEKSMEHLDRTNKFADTLLEKGNSSEILALKPLIVSHLLRLISTVPKPKIKVELEFVTDMNQFKEAAKTAFGYLKHPDYQPPPPPPAPTAPISLPLHPTPPPTSMPPPMTNGLINGSISVPSSSVASSPVSMPSSFDSEINFSTSVPPPPAPLSLTSIQEYNLTQLATLAAGTEKSPSPPSIVPVSVPVHPSPNPSPTSGFNLVDLFSGDISSTSNAINNLQALAKLGSVAFNDQDMPNGPANGAPPGNALLPMNRAASPLLDNLSSLTLSNPTMNNGSNFPPSALTPNGKEIVAEIPPPMGVFAQQIRANSNAKLSSMQIRSKFGQLGPGKGQFSSPHGFCLGVEEDIVVADTNNHRIQVFDKEGNFKFHFGVPGKEEGQLWYPRKVAVMKNSGKFVVCDRGNERSRMQIFSKGGHFIKRIAIRYIDIVAGLAVSAQGNIIAVDSVSPTVFIISEHGNLIHWFDCSEHMREPSDIAINGREYFVCDFKGHCVVVFNEAGIFLRRIGCESITSFPNGIDISDAGDILVGDSHGNRFHIAVFTRDGNVTCEFECPYVKVSRCCGLKITSEGYVVTLAKNNHHVLILNTLYIV